MSKKLRDMKWDSVALEGFQPDDFQGFVGLEECTSYALDKDKKIQRKKKEPKKRQNEDKVTPAVPNKKVKPSNEKPNKPDKSSNEKPKPNKPVKLSNGFIVESMESVTPSSSNEIPETSNSKLKTNDKNTNKTGDIKSGSKNKNNKKSKPKLGEVSNETKSMLTPEDMLTWAEFKLPEPILRAMAELGFKQPTKIQQLSLPAAIHGRRDILGAAETGSGKTLAFGLPILSGILKLKEKAAAGFDVYDIAYKKSSAKRKPEVEKKSKKKVFGKKKNKKVPEKKESSEEGYSSGDDDDDDADSVNEPADDNEIANSNDEYLEEIEVPLRKREASNDEGNDSDDSSNFIHLSEMLDSDDLAVNSDESVDSDGEEAGSDGKEASSDDEEAGSDGEKAGNDDGELIVDESDEAEEELNENEQGIGCVKVIDNVELPGHVEPKTGKLLYALILTPTRELAMQVSRHLIAVAKYTGIKVATIVGGMASVKQERVLRSGPEIVVATPGRLFELLATQQHLQQLSTVKFLAIDETDRMIERGHFEELYPLLERLNADEDKRSARQNFVFSATLTMVHELPTHMKGKKVTKRGKILNRKVEKMTPQQKIKRLVDMFGMTDPKVVDITTENLGTAESLTESKISCPLEHKDAYLYYILRRHPGRSIVFCNSIGSVKRLAQLFTLLECKPLPLHASMPQRQRLKNLERFRDDPQGVLVATDVAARGLDVPGVDHVIHYQVPRTAENYVHRSGRTARANKEGLTILMMEPTEAYLYTKICRTLNKTSEVPTFPVPATAVPSIIQTINLARDIDVLSLKRRRASQAIGWREKAAKEMDMLIDDDDVPVQKIDPSIDKALSHKRKQLLSMLSRPLFPKGFSFKYPTLNDPLALVPVQDNALQVMKKSLETGELKKQKRKSKNAPLLKLEKQLKSKKNK